MSKDRCHYDVMGLQRDASADEVRRRFRELARKYHPDHHSEHPEYHEVFVRITQAHQVLSDANRRAAYDLNLRDQERRSAGAAAGSYGAASRPQAPPGAARPRPPGTVPSRRELELERRRLFAVKRFEEANFQYLRGNLRDAKRLAGESIESFRTGAAYELLGDIAFRQNRLDRALEHFTVAAQLLPNNGQVMAKLNRVMARQQDPSRERPSAPGARPKGRPRRSLFATPAAQLAYRLSLCAIGLVGVITLGVAWPGLDKTPLELLPVADWTVVQALFMVLAGFIAGGVLAAAGLLRPIEDELIMPSLGARRQSFPVGIILALFGVVFLPLALITYGIIAFRQGAASFSVLATFGLSAILAVIFLAAAAAPAAQTQTLLFGGNVIFVSMLVGWFFGDLFRPGWAV